LIRASLPEFLLGFGVPPSLLGHALLDCLCWPLAYRFAALAASYDAEIGARGLPAAAEWLLQRRVDGVAVAGWPHVPHAGALLVVANHPGLADAPALFAALGRRDLRVVAADRPFVRALPNLGHHLILVPADGGARREAVRAVVGHLRAGGAVLTFPAGRIEPDPAVLPGAAAALSDWSPSIGLFLRLAPRTMLLPALVSGVLSPHALRNPLTRLRRQPRDQEWLAALLQVLLPGYQGGTVRVAFGPPATGAALSTRGRAAPALDSALALKCAIVARMEQLLTAPPDDWCPLWTPAPSAEVSLRRAPWRARRRPRAAV
jgi:1-acyl-sn-glycerol-3-phosphate acyltransferase